jgi:hypothetical protein
MYVDNNGNAQLLEVDTPHGNFTYNHDQIINIFGGNVNIPDISNAINARINGVLATVSQWIQLFNTIDNLVKQYQADAQNFARIGQAMYDWVTNDFFPWYTAWWRQAAEVAIIAALVAAVAAALYWGWILLF